MRFKCLFVLILLISSPLQVARAAVHIELPKPEEFQSLSPVFQSYENEYQEWKNVFETDPEQAEIQNPNAQAAWILKNQIFQTKNPKEDFQNIFKSYLTSTDPYNSTYLSPLEKLAPQLELFTILGVGAMAAIATMPESFTQWNLKELQQRRTAEVMWSHIQKGPVLDSDNWAVNFIGHPISGGMYYLLARHSGFTWAESMTFSILMSTFFWEYGLEATIEVPSLTDLVITPLLGSVIGEVFYHAESAILKNHNQILGSKVFGYTSRTLMNPAGILTQLLNSEKRPNTSGYFKIGYFAETKRFGVVDPAMVELYYGIRLRVWF